MKILGGCKITKLECNFYDVCFPSYFGGHYKPIIQIPIYAPMYLKEIKEALLNELNELYNHYEYSVETKDFEAWFNAACIAVTRITNAPGFKGKHFKDIEFCDDDDDDDDFIGCCYAYFIINEV
jgi:hypothetical protein